MDASKLRAWWSNRQGLDGSLSCASPAEVLARSGWARSVGGSNPYLTLFARAGTSVADAEAANARLEIGETPSARGCTYFLPAGDFALGLRVAEPFGGSTELATARKLGVTDSEIDALCRAAYEALLKEQLDPKALRDRLGSAVRNLGEEGKKRGLQTTLPLATGILQRDGKIVRIPINGRLDTQRFAYRAWPEGPPKEGWPTAEDAAVQLARRYWEWIGPATVEQFRWFSGFGVGAAARALEPLALQPISEGSAFLLLPGQVQAFHDFGVPHEPSYALVSSLDSLVLLRRDLASLIEPADSARDVFAEKGTRQIGHLLDLPSNGIFDRGRLIGLWEYDPFEKELVVQIWAESADDLSGKGSSRRNAPEALREAIDRTEAYVRAQLGDARSFSLDSPGSRKPLLAALRGWPQPGNA
ncbi:MAG: winged helix DNA-binding domain-containing protein [Armatimonadetes bacterium]|nr:winged helix DNA-binding domain-containing protein [Armatimonadota bacterium]